MACLPGVRRQDRGALGRFHRRDPDVSQQSGPQAWPRRFPVVDAASRVGWVTKNYYTKCEQVINSLTCTSLKSIDISLAVVKRVFVDSSKVAATTQDGNAWATAYGNLTTGLNSAQSGIEVWVAKGTYKPTTGTIRTTSFVIPSGVKVLGGFTGNENYFNSKKCIY